MRTELKVELNMLLAQIIPYGHIVAVIAPRDEARSRFTVGVGTIVRSQTSSTTRASSRGAMMATERRSVHSTRSYPVLADVGQSTFGLRLKRGKRGNNTQW